MNAPSNPRPLPWLQPGEPFPPSSQAWGPLDPAPGLLAAGGALDVHTLISAYRQGIFPWFSEGQPPLWWATNPRMVLKVSDFKLHPSLKKLIKSLLKQGRLRIAVDEDFAGTVMTCAQVPRRGQMGTWIVEAMRAAYLALHEAGHAHSIEAWVDGQRWGGLYFVNIGHMVYGESMFSLHTNGSKLALSALVAMCRASGLPAIDCQQQTGHLGRLGARPLPMTEFTQLVAGLINAAEPRWRFAPLYWNSMFNSTADARDAPERPAF